MPKFCFWKVLNWKVIFLIIFRVFNSNFQFFHYYFCSNKVNFHNEEPYLNFLFIWLHSNHFFLVIIKLLDPMTVTKMFGYIDHCIWQALSSLPNSSLTLTNPSSCNIKLLHQTISRYLSKFFMDQFPKHLRP